MAKGRNQIKTIVQILQTRSKQFRNPKNNFQTITEIRKTILKQLRKTEKQLRKNNCGKKRIWEKECWEKKNVGNQVKLVRNQVRGLLT